MTTLGPWRWRRRAASLSVRPAFSPVPSRRSTSSSSTVSCNRTASPHHLPGKQAINHQEESSILTSSAIALSSGDAIPRLDRLRPPLPIPRKRIGKNGWAGPRSSGLLGPIRHCRIDKDSTGRVPHFRSFLFPKPLAHPHQPKNHTSDLAAAAVRYSLPLFAPVRG
ncbi:hypothetical protein GUJ93_ZPchr0006g42440 [Zizania palustris]|uniref:Uncharacterized protein n=1 Tax=Zizania palustris TaxID=103762 RepID=A0A8J5VVM5_ZIZPA|nr:hypothetical protein GUJ93_ZPchr0006g42440 [Zizania palustris]